MTKKPFKMAGMSFKGESPVRKNVVGKFIESRVNRVKTNAQGVVDRVKGIVGGSGNKTTAEDKADADYYGSSSDKMMEHHGEVVNSSKKAQDDASSSTEAETPKTPMAKRAPTRKYKKKK